MPNKQAKIDIRLIAYSFLKQLYKVAIGYCIQQSQEVYEHLINKMSLSRHLLMLTQTHVVCIIML